MRQDRSAVAAAVEDEQSKDHEPDQVLVVKKITQASHGVFLCFLQYFPGAARGGAPAGARRCAAPALALILYYAHPSPLLNKNAPAGAFLTRRANVRRISRRLCESADLPYKN